jgi:hypothetical protein
VSKGTGVFLRGSCALSFVLGGSFLGCAVQNTPVTSGGSGGGNTHRGSTVTSSRAGGSSSGGASSSTTSTSSTVSGGSSGASTSAATDAGPQDAGWPPPVGSEICPAGSVHFTGQTYTFGPCVPGASAENGPVPAVQVTTLEPWGATTSDSQGLFTLCVPNGTPFTVQFLATGFAPGYLAEAILNQDQSTTGNALYLLCETLVEIFQAESSGWNFATQGSVLVSIVSSASGNGPCNPSGPGLSGWHVQSSLPDGGEPTAGPMGWPVGYLDSSGQPSSTVSSTYSDGYAIVYNIDSSLDLVAIQVDGGPTGAVCPTSNPELGFDGLVHVQPGGFGMFPYAIP